MEGPNETRETQETKETMETYHGDVYTIYYRGGSRIITRGVLLVEMRAKFLKPRPLPRKPRPFSCIFGSQTALQQLRVNEVQIFAKVSESKTLLASILVREGVLLIQMSARVNQISTLNV